jgi:hypothetical protein
MTRTEQRLLDAMRAKTSAVRDDALRPLTEPSKERSREHRGWLAPLAPLAAAVAVALVAVLAVTLTGSQHSSTSSGPAVPAPAAVQPSRPQFFTEVFGNYLQVRSVATGKVIGKLPMTEQELAVSWGIAAAPDGRTFYLVRSPSSSTRPVIYSFQVTGNDTVTPLRYVASGPSGDTGDVRGQGPVVSPDGTELALGMHTVAGYYDETDTIVVFDLRTGAYHLWRGGLPRTVKGVSLNIWDLSWSGTRRLDFISTWCTNVKWLYCGSGSAQVRELTVGPDGSSLAGSTVLIDLARFPDITDMVADQQGHLVIMQVSGQGKTPYGVPLKVSIDRVAAAGGAELRMLYRRIIPQEPGFAGPIIADPSGQYLMVWLPGRSGWLHDGTLHPLPVNQPYPFSTDFAW